MGFGGRNLPLRNRLMRSRCALVAGLAWLATCGASGWCAEPDDQGRSSGPPGASATWGESNPSAAAVHNGYPAASPLAPPYSAQRPQQLSPTQQPQPPAPRQHPQHGDPELLAYQPLHHLLPHPPGPQPPSRRGAPAPRMAPPIVTPQPPPPTPPHPTLPRETLPPPDSSIDRLPPCSDPAHLFGPPADDVIPLRLRYKYNFGGGYLNIASPRETVVINLQNQVTLDGTFFDRPDMPTQEQGFNIPFNRTYLYGNVTESWQFQLATQSFLGQFNILDAFVNWRYDDGFNIRVGRGLSPMLYEYYAFSPAWEPVIDNSMLFQLAGKRQQGVMFWGNVADGTIQYQAGPFNGVSGAFYDLDRNVDFLGSICWTPGAHTDTIFDGFGVGASMQTGQHNYALNQTGSAWTNGAGEPTTNINYITSSGVPFFAYDINTFADGMQTKVAPQIFWFDRFSVLAEYLYCTRELSLGSTRGVTVQRGWYVNTSYFLTGERYTGNGLIGYTTINPLRPFRPARGQMGPGAWELAAQFSQISLNPNNFNFVAQPDVYASRCDQLMIGVNWWPNRYTRISVDNVFTWFNQPVLLGNAGTASQFNTFWMRCAMFF